ncbi:MAG: hypothetical protein RRA94_00585 [Bacteroidota bacterium]|nr:hypothetical protein [Bacteroidota bacterium]
MALPRFEKEWNGFRGHVAVKWDKLSEDDLLKVEGNFPDLVTLISGRYKEQKSVVEAKLHDLYAGYLETKEKITQGVSDARADIGSRTQDLTENIREKASEFERSARDRISRIREENIDPAVEKSEEYIKVHPFSAVMGAFGVGMLIGSVIGLLTSRGKD